MKFYLDHALSDSTAHIGEFIRELRRKQGYTQQSLAGLSGVGPRFLSELENGKPNVQLDLVLRVLTVLGAEVSVSNTPLVPAPDTGVVRGE